MEKNLKSLQVDKNRSVTLLTVVCVTRNAAHCIEGFLASYRKERVATVQLVVVDGASTDESWEILLRNMDIIDMAVSEPDAGIYDAWNKSLSMCVGRYVSFIGADDRIAEGAINSLINVIRDETHHNAHIISGFNILTRKAVPVAMLGTPYKVGSLERRMSIAHVMSAHRLDWLISVGGFNSSYRSAGDYELLLRERADLRVKVVNAIFAYMEDGGVSRTTLGPLYEAYRARRSNGVPFLLCAALLARAYLGVFARKLGIRR